MIPPKPTIPSSFLTAASVLSLRNSFEGGAHEFGFAASTFCYMHLVEPVVLNEIRIGNSLFLHDILRCDPFLSILTIST